MDRAVPGRKRQRVLLWIVAALVLPLAAFPHYSGLFGGVGASADHTAMASTSAAAGMATVVFDVEVMTCEACAAGMQATLTQEAGVSSVTVDYEERVAYVIFDPSLVSVKRLTESIAKLGFTASPRKSG
jgi:copper chaperone CopZ